MLLITKEQVQAMLAAQDRAAEQFWAYPDPEWQMNFQWGYLTERFGAGEAIDEDGRAWGE